MSKAKEPKQAEPQAVFSPEAELAAGRAAQPIDFTGVLAKTDAMNEPELVINWESRFIAQASSLGSQLIMKVGREGPVGNARPNYLSLSRLADDETAIAATPAPAESASTVPIRWIDDGGRAIISLQKLFTIRHFSIPRRTTVHIPITEESIETAGPSVILHLAEATFVRIDTRPREKAVAPSEGAAPDGSTQDQE